MIDESTKAQVYNDYLEGLKPIEIQTKYYISRGSYYSIINKYKKLEEDIEENYYTTTTDESEFEFTDTEEYDTEDIELLDDFSHYLDETEEEYTDEEEEEYYTEETVSGIQIKKSTLYKFVGFAGIVGATYFYLYHYNQTSNTELKQ